GPGAQALDHAKSLGHASWLALVLQESAGEPVIVFCREGELAGATQIAALLVADGFDPVQGLGGEAERLLSGEGCPAHTHALPQDVGPGPWVLRLPGKGDRRLESPQCRLGVSFSPPQP